MSNAIGIVDDIVTRLNTLSLAKAFSAQKRLFPRLEYRDIDDLIVDVFASGQAWERENRCGTHNKSYEITVIVAAPINQSQTTANMNTELEGFIDFCEAVKEDLAPLRMNGFVLQEITQDEPFDFAGLQEMGLFFSLITLEYKGF